MKRNQMYGLIGIAGVGTAIMLSVGSLLGSSDTKPLVEVVSAPVFLEAGDYERKSKRANLSVRRKKSEQTIELLLEPGDTLLGALVRAGVSGSEARAASDSLKSMIDLRALKVGQELKLSFRAGDEAATERRLESLALVPEIDRLVAIKRSADNNFEAQTQLIEHSIGLISASGKITASLYEAARNQDTPMPVLLQTYSLLGKAVDFQRDIRKGDRFVLGYEKFDDGDFGGEHTGKLVYVSLTLANRTLSYFRYKASDGFIGYFDAYGNSVQTSLTKTPVDGGQLSSLFGNREHPVLGYARMHKGLDFAAPRGTPVFAAGDGVVTRRTRNGSYGKYISIRHDNQYDSGYAHLSKYADNLEKGDRVQQGEVIGYVGATGLTTGPNLHYEVLQDGEQVNPMTINLPPQRVLTGNELVRFREATTKLLLALKLNASKSEALSKPNHVKTGPSNG
ncbi:M23 family metallopeptidase [uncultured Sneathiella sp.]|jgi:murein DD-endopeptidase MepM/ murein hydrolase activator NlpD|uniref:M23 family metallopeptidase n=1 Tax=uncultured Sneathiella sp. TaxID=879315 RepID=UPI0030D6E92D|tara:strand:+ start:2720 stop:4072 length:1353 start_codon:yes stop_codon:yes gene_type:complete